MSKIVLLLSSFLFLHILTCHSQPVIDKLYDYQPGMTYNYFIITPGKQIDTTLLPTYGINLVWDLDSLPWESQIQSDSIMSFAQSSQPSSFANSSYVYREYSGLEQFYRKSNDTLFYMGNASTNKQFAPNAITVVYPTIFKPSGFNYSNYQTNVPWNNDIWTFSGRYNAYGTLKLGGNTYPNIALYISKGGMPGQFYTDYMWVGQGETFPKVRIQFAEIGINFSVQLAYALVDAVLSVDENYSKSDLKVYPNPSYGKVFIDVGHENQYIVLKQFDTYGRLMAEKSFFSPSTLQFDLTGDPGLYILELTQNSKISQIIKVLKK